MPKAKRVSERVASRRRGEKRKKDPERAKTNIDHHSEETEVSKARTAEPLVQHDDLTTLNENAKLGQGGGDREELGMCSVSGGANFTSSIVSYENSLGLNLSQELKNKIIRGEYVELDKMLTNYNEPQKQTLVLVNGELHATEKSNRKINNIQQWTDAFLIFSSVYLQAHPAKNLELLKYMRDVRLAASRCSNLGFMDYDQQFRLKRARHPTGSWGEVDSELWLLYIVNSNTKELTAVNTNQGQLRKCYTYNYQGSCFKTPCGYLHCCIKCNGNHPYALCSNRERGASQRGFGVSQSFRAQGRSNMANSHSYRGRGMYQVRGNRGAL